MFYFGTNTKQQLDIQSHEDIVEIASLLAKTNKDTQFFVLPTMPLVRELKMASHGTGLWVGAQRVSGTQKNITGKISAKLLSDSDLDLVMVGHAERRAFGEDSEAEIINQLKALIEVKLPILYCIGEEHLENDKVKRKDWFKKQLVVLRDLFIEKAIIAYEPVWSIGEKGTPAQANYVEESFELIKECLKELERKVDNFPLLYGGSVNMENAKQLASLDNCDGLFVGRSAWSRDGFRNVYEKAHSGYRSRI